MSRRGLPRLEVIEAFIEAARASSFRIAADRCMLSPAAFSRRIQAFTQYVGRDLFERGQRGMQLTDAGRDCLSELEPVYLEMRRAAADIGRASSKLDITISLSHSLAVGWLIPRLDMFHGRNPGIQVIVRTDRTAGSIRSGDADVGFCANDVDLKDLRVQALLDIHVSPVASPTMADAIRRGAVRMEDCRLLGMRQHPDIWNWWAKETKWSGPVRSPGPVFDVQHAMYEAAASGIGIAAGADVTVGPHLTFGRLFHLGLPSARYPGGYSLAATPARLRSPSTRLLWSWLVGEARGYRPSWVKEESSAAA